MHMILPPQDHITVVSGLPRSGTSLLMQMLEAGGMDVLQDRIRKADDDNPKGYFEYGPVKELKNDNSWIHIALGKAIKVIHLLLPHLPAEFNYNVLFVMRDLDEVLSSQSIMLKRLGKIGAGPGQDALKSIFQRELDKTQTWLSTQPNIRTLVIQHRKLIGNPPVEAGRISSFLAQGLNEQAMAHVVDPALYRNRIK